MLENLITDRTQADVDRAKQLNDTGAAAWTAADKAEYMAHMKGAYNYSDINRVEEACEYLYARFCEIGGNGLNPTYKKNWTKIDFMSEDEAKRFLQNIRDLRAQFAVPEGAPEVPDDMQGFTFEEANDIERILEIIDEYITKTIACYFFSGELYGGET